MRPKIPLKLAKRFRRVCPEWARHVLDGHLDPDLYDVSFNGNDGQIWALGISSCCIVGEAHKRKSYHGMDRPIYGCDACAVFSEDLMDVNDSDWLDTLRRFLDHYEKEHAMEVAA